MTLFFKFFKRAWEFLNKLNPETRSMLIIILFGYVMYSLINRSTYNIIDLKTEQTIKEEKQAELYSKDTAMSINRHVRLIAHKDSDAFDVLLLSYHNSKASLQGYRFLYLSCITESPKSIDYPLIKNLWANLDYIYYVDELEKIHNLEIVKIFDIENMKESLPKLYRLVESSDAKAVSFYVIEGKYNPIGIIVILYKNIDDNKKDKSKIIMPSILKLAILLDYDGK